MVNFFSGYIDPSYRAAMHDFFAKHGKELEAMLKHGAKLSDARAAATRMGAGELAQGAHRECSSTTSSTSPRWPASITWGSAATSTASTRRPSGLEGIDGLPKITLELLRRGWSDADVKKVLGENFLRVFSAAEAHARATKTTLSGDGSTRHIE